MNVNEVHEWIRLAKNDVATVNILLREKACPDIAIYHMHQAVEKYLKALLLKNNQIPKKTHALDFLLTEVTKIYPKLEIIREDVEKLHELLPELRYPYHGEELTLTDAQEINQNFEIIRKKVLSILQS